MRSLFLLALVLSYKAAFGQSAPIGTKANADVRPWSVVTSFNGNDSYTDHGPQVLFPQARLSWDGKTGSGMMNGCDWLQSSWFGNTPKLCAVESMGTVTALIVWKGKGPAPKSVDVTIDSAVYARTTGSGNPTMILSNGLGSATKSLTSGYTRESSAKGSKTVTLPVENGLAKCSFGMTGRLSAMTVGTVALRMDVRFTPN